MIASADALTSVTAGNGSRGGLGRSGSAPWPGSVDRWIAYVDLAITLYAALRLPWGRTFGMHEAITRSLPRRSPLHDLDVLVELSAMTPAAAIKVAAVFGAGCRHTYGALKHLLDPAVVAGLGHTRPDNPAFWLSGSGSRMSMVTLG
jgi:hypothetical protein